MLNSDRDLDIHSLHQIAGSRSRLLLSLDESSVGTDCAQRNRQSAIPIFAEATAQASSICEAPIAILTTIGGSNYQIAAISGLERLGLPTQTNLHLELSGLEYCHASVLAATQKFVALDLPHHPQLSGSRLERVHSIRAYLGVPIVTAARDRLGTISILDVRDRQFTARDVELLQLIANLVASEFERTLLSQAQLTRSIGNLYPEAVAGFDDGVAVSESQQANALGDSPQGDSCAIVPIYPQVQSEIQFKLLTHLARELRAPLTSILGMASVLQQQIYGTLSSKQKDYLRIVHQSGQQLVAIVDEIDRLGGFDPASDRLSLKAVDIETIAQSALHSLEPLAQKKQQQLTLDSCALTQRIWRLDKEKVRQIIYYLGLSAICSSNSDTDISIELTDLGDVLQLCVATADRQAILLPIPSCEDVGAESLLTDRPGSGDRHVRNEQIELGLCLSQLFAIAHHGELTTDDRSYCLRVPLIKD